MADWQNRPRVKKCTDRQFWHHIACPRCGYDEPWCYHIDNLDGECNEEACPLWDGRRWKKEQPDG